MARQGWQTAVSLLPHTPGAAPSSPPASVLMPQAWGTPVRLPERLVASPLTMHAQAAAPELLPAVQVLKHTPALACLAAARPQRHTLVHELLAAAQPWRVPALPAAQPLALVLRTPDPDTTLTAPRLPVSLCRAVLRELQRLPCTLAPDRVLTARQAAGLLLCRAVTAVLRAERSLPPGPLRSPAPDTGYLLFRRRCRVELQEL